MLLKHKWLVPILILWQLPQILIGLLFALLFWNYEIYTNDFNGITVLRVDTKGKFGTACFSSGPVILVPKDVSEKTLRHETGHSKQSLYFGWLFHIIVSLPSICRFWYKRIKKKSSSWYHSGYPENWADKLGGVHRS